MSITYTYKIISVDKSARCMEVIYSAEGHQTMHISARLPFENELLEDVIKSFSPVALWAALARPVYAPVVGSEGVINPEPAAESPPEYMPAAGRIPITIAE
jgi:hypothetical protein